MNDLIEQAKRAKCVECDRTRARGWVLVNGLCLRCGPFEFMKRRNELKEQARKLREETDPS